MNLDLILLTLIIIIVCLLLLYVYLCYSKKEYFSFFSEKISMFKYGVTTTPGSKSDSCNIDNKPPPFPGSEYGIKSSYEYRDGHSKFMDIKDVKKEGIDPYEDIEILKKIIKDKKGEQKKWNDISSRDKKLIAAINFQFKNKAKFVDDIENKNETNNTE